jgi:group I intron endonuclease
MGKLYSIYLITNVLNGKSYVGFTSMSLRVRFQLHQSAARNGSECWLHKSIRKYGASAFLAETLYVSKDHDNTMNIMEPFFIDKYKSFGKGYNMTPGGDSGAIYTEDRRNKLKMSMKTNTNPMGWKWYNNGTDSIRSKDGCPSGFQPGRLIGNWYNDGIRSIRLGSGVKIPSGWTKGRH